MKTFGLYLLPVLLAVACAPKGPRDAKFTQDVSAVTQDSSQSVEVSVAEMEAAEQDNFMHHEDADMEIVLKWGDLKAMGKDFEFAVGLAQGDGDFCTITLDNSLKLSKCAPIMMGYCQALLEHVVRHETGHCFGFAHNEKDVTDVMYPYAEAIQWAPENVARFNEALKKKRLGK